MIESRIEEDEGVNKKNYKEFKGREYRRPGN